MQISRPKGFGMVISLVSMIDVLMILLVFFMVTSTYLDLDMVPLAGADGPPGAGSSAGGAPPDRLLVRLSSDGAAYMRGRPFDPAALTARLVDTPGLDILVLPSGQANVQALAGLMDVLVGAGAQRLRIVRLEAQP